MHTPGNRRHAQALGSIRDTTVRAEVADVLGNADMLARTVPLSEVHDALAALWLVFVATDQPERFSDGARRVLVSLADDDLTRVGARLDMWAALGPEDRAKSAE